MEKKNEQIYKELLTKTLDPIYISLGLQLNSI